MQYWSAFYIVPYVTDASFVSFLLSLAFVLDLSCYVYNIYNILFIYAVSIALLFAFDAVQNGHGIWGKIA